MAGADPQGDSLATARALLDALRAEARLDRRVELAAAIEALGDANEDAELGAVLAAALQHVATADGAGPEVRLGAAERLRGLREAHGVPPFAAAEARVLASATVGLEEPAACLEIARRINELNEHYGLEVVAAAEAVACFNAAAVSSDRGLVRAIAQRLGRLREQHSAAAIAAQESSAWVCASALEEDPVEAWNTADHIAALREDWRDAALAEDEAKAVANAIDVEPDAARRQAGMRRLRALLAAQPREAIAVALAHALYQVHGARGGVHECRYAADEVAELNEAFGSREVALLEGHILRNATAEATDADDLDALVVRLERLVTTHTAPDVAAQLVHGLLNRMARTDEPGDRVPDLERAAAVLARSPEDGAATRLGQALATDQFNDLDPTRAAARVALARELLRVAPGLVGPLREGADEVIGRTHDGDAIARIEAVLRG